MLKTNTFLFPTRINLLTVAKLCESSCALALVNCNCWVDEIHWASVIFDKVIWWRQMVEQSASRLAEIPLKPLVPKQCVMIYESAGLKEITHWTALEPQHLDLNSVALIYSPVRWYEAQTFDWCFKELTTLSEESTSVNAYGRFSVILQYYVWVFAVIAIVKKMELHYLLGDCDITLSRCVKLGVYIDQGYSHTMISFLAFYNPHYLYTYK